MNTSTVRSPSATCAGGGEHLIEQANKKEKEEYDLTPFTMEEIDAMLDESEAAFEAGDYLTNEEVFQRIN